MCEICSPYVNHLNLKARVRGWVLRPEPRLALEAIQTFSGLDEKGKRNIEGGFT